MAAKRPDREVFIRINAYLVLGLAFLVVLAGLAGSVLPWFFFPGSDLIKKIILSCSSMAVGLTLFFILLGRYEFLMEFLSMEEEVERLESKEEGQNG